jgi:hypothetical protein
VHEHTCPSYLQDSFDAVFDRARKYSGGAEKVVLGTTGRLSLTFRDAPSVVGREHEFATFKVSEHFDKEANFNWNANEDDLIKSQPGQKKNRRSK